MVNYSKDIMIDMSYSDIGLKFNSSYYINAIKDCIDSINEGSSCDDDKVIPNIYIFIENNKISSSVIYMNYVNEIGIEIEKELNKLNIYKSVKVLIDTYESIFNEAKKFKNIILGSNIITYFAVKENINSIEDMTIIAFQFGPLKMEDINRDLLKKLIVFKDDGNFYLDNPLIQDFYITYTDLNFLN